QHIHRNCSKRNIVVTHEDDLLFVQCDARLIIQVILNLVDNAIKYTPDISSIRISTKQLNHDVIFTVADDGPGIPDAEKPHIFQMFYTGSTAAADSRRSLGLGLSLCKSIVDAHGGTITVSDNTPRGAVFTFILPSGEVQVHE
ncbi:MAG: histidine kinase, partial [Oscillospiraceae bacterium]|nr:histidine kinase [Oscillospiraceae bacterium]